jgi:hypothetical protein
LVSHPLLLRLVFSRTFWHLANHAAKNAQQRADGFRKPRLGRRKQNIAARVRTAVRLGRQPNLAAITRSFAAPISMPSAPIAVLLSAPPRWQRWQHWQSATASSRKMTTWSHSQRPIVERAAIRGPSALCLTKSGAYGLVCPIARSLGAACRIGWRRAPETLAIDRGWLSPQKPVARVTQPCRGANQIPDRIRDAGNATRAATRDDD